MMEWNLYPQGTMKFATHLHRTGSIKTLPASWKDYYLPVAHDLPGSWSASTITSSNNMFATIASVARDKTRKD